MSLGNTPQERREAIAKLESEAATDQGLRPQSKRLARKVSAAVRRRLPPSSRIRKSISAGKKIFAPSPYERLQQRRTANAKQSGNQSDLEVAAIPPTELPSNPDAVARSKRGLPAFYHQQIDGKTQAELLEMRDWPRSRIPSQFTVKDWRTKIRGELQQWATDAMKPESLRQGTAPAATTSTPPGKGPNAGESVKDQVKAVLEEAKVAPEKAGTEKQDGFDSLSESDLSLLSKRASDVVHDREAFERYQSIHHRREHPDTGRPIDFDQENARAKETQVQSDAAAVQNAEPGGDEAAPDQEPSRGSTAMDTLQLGLDAVGIADPTPIADGANAAISLGRMFTDPERRREHFRNAAISAISMVPYIGDTAKLLKAKSAGKTLSRASRMSKGAGAATDGLSAATKRNRRSQYRDAAESVLGSGGDRKSDGRDENQERRDAERENTVNKGMPGEYQDAQRRAADVLDRSRTSTGDPDKDPREIERRIEGQKALQEMNDDFKEKLIDTVLAVGAFGSALVVGVKSIGKVIAINRGFVDSYRHLGDFDAAVAGTYMRHEVAEMRRNIRKGRQLRGAIDDVAQADSDFADVRDRIGNPIEGIKMDLTSTVTQSAADLGKAADNITKVSTFLHLFGVGLDALTNKVTNATGAFKDVTELPGAMARQMAGVNGNDGTGPNPDAPPWTNLLDDVRDGKYDGKSEAGQFFSKDF